MPRQLRCTLLCEDIEQESFSRPILERRFGRGRVYVEARRKGEPGGFNFVFQSYPNLVKKLVRRYPQEAVGLTVVVDGDKAGVDQRLRELDQVIERAGYETRASKEKIAACVPTRNMETWELWLCGRRDLDESNDYKAVFRTEKRHGTMSSAMAAQAWFVELSEADRTAENDKLPSLSAGRMELDRLYSLARRI